MEHPIPVATLCGVCIMGTITVLNFKETKEDDMFKENLYDIQLSVYSSMITDEEGDRVQGSVLSTRLEQLLNGHRTDNQ